METPSKPPPTSPAAPQHDEFHHVGDLRFSLYYHTMAKSSVFDRLSNTPTRASSSRDDEERRLRKEREANRRKILSLSPQKLGSGLSTPVKNRRSCGAAMLSSPPGAGVYTSPKRTPQQLDEIFERIYKHDTASSLAYQQAVAAVTAGRPSHSGSNNNCNYNSSNLSSSARTATGTGTMITAKAQDPSTSSPYKCRYRSPSKPLTSRPRDRMAVTGAAAATTRANETPIALFLKSTHTDCTNNNKNTSLYKSSSIFKKVNLSQLHKVHNSLFNYWNCKLSARSCALDIIEALFRREYAEVMAAAAASNAGATVVLVDAGSGAVEWDVYPATCHEDHDGVGVFYVEKRAVKNQKNGTYGSAMAKGRVKFVKGEGVFVDDYSFTTSE